MWPLFQALAKRPLLLIRGSESDLVGAAAFARMLQQAPGAAFVEIPGVGHAPDLDEPAALDAVQSFLERVAT
jgi:pimeloyl-ACP methyl ester carboxylesterase